MRSDSGEGNEFEVGSGAIGAQGGLARCSYHDDLCGDFLILEQPCRDFYLQPSFG